jgi:hypothetical protein
MHINQKKTSIIALLFVASLLVVFPIQMVKAQTTTTVTVTPQNSTPVVGQTITISIQLNNVQNLYGIDVTLTWNTALLSFQTNSNQTFLGVSNGVLNPPPSSISVVLDSASQAIGEFHLVVTSVAPATGFSGSGTIATLKFTVTGAGDSNLALTCTLADYAPGGISEPITATVTGGTVDATTSSSSSSPSSSPTPTSSSSSSSPSPTSTIPEFPLIAALSIVVVLSSIAIVLAVKKIIKPTSTSNFIQFPDNPTTGTAKSQLAMKLMGV